jgi:hypothetical protein
MTPNHPQSYKVKVYNSAVRSVLLYGCETWPLKVQDIARLQAFEYRCWRQFLGISPLDLVSNNEVIARIKPKTLCSAEVTRRRLMFLGHILRRPDTFIPKRCLLTKPEEGWRRRPGGQRINWRRTVYKDVNTPQIRRAYGSSAWESNWVTILEHTAQDRSQWKIMTKDILSRKFPDLHREH